MSTAPRPSSRPTTPPPAEIQRFAAAVPVGRAHAQTAAQICLALGYVDAAGEPTENHKRRVRLLAQHAVNADHLICGDDTGYFVPASAEEMSEMFGRFESQMALMRERLRKLRALSDKLFYAEQGRLW